MGAQPQHENTITWKTTRPRLRVREPLPANDEIIIAGLGIPLEFDWTGRDIHRFIELWNDGLSLLEMANHWPKRNPDDVLLLWLHCKYKNWIEDRPGEIYGRGRG